MELACWHLTYKTENTDRESGDNIVSRIFEYIGLGWSKMVFRKGDVFLGSSWKWRDRDLVLEQSWKEILGDGNTMQKKMGRKNLR